MSFFLRKPASTSFLRIVMVAGFLAFVAVIALFASSPQPNPPSLGGFTPAVSPSVSADILRTYIASGDPVRLRLEVVDEVTTDPTAFVQGLQFSPTGDLLVSTGLYGASTIRRVDADTGDILLVQPLNPEWFAEGLTVVFDSGYPQVMLLTWREGVVVFLDPVTLLQTRRISFDSESWGVCQVAANSVVVSDGSSLLTIRDSQTFAAKSSVSVTRSGVPVSLLNELECVDGLVWANVWKTDTPYRQTRWAAVGGDTNGFPRCL